MLEIVFEGIWLTGMCISDIRCKRIPLWTIGLGVPAAVIGMASKCSDENFCLPEILISLIPGAILLLAAFAEKAGYGDGLVFLLLGLADKEKNCMTIFLMSLVFMSLFAVSMLILRRVKKETRLPYLPFLLLAWIAGRTLL